MSFETLSLLHCLLQCSSSSVSVLWIVKAVVQWQIQVIVLAQCSFSVVDLAQCSSSAVDCQVLQWQFQVIQFQLQCSSSVVSVLWIQLSVAPVLWIVKEVPCYSSIQPSAASVLWIGSYTLQFQLSAVSVDCQACSVVDSFVCTFVCSLHLLRHKVTKTFLGCFPFFFPQYSLSYISTRIYSNCETQRFTDQKLSSTMNLPLLFLCPASVTSPLYDVLDHTNHTFLKAHDTH